jgi:hypothetical protein
MQFSLSPGAQAALHGAHILIFVQVQPGGIAININIKLTITIFYNIALTIHDSMSL